jgi:hypothetical protein
MEIALGWQQVWCDGFDNQTVAKRSPKIFGAEKQTGNPATIASKPE